MGPTALKKKLLKKRFAFQIIEKMPERFQSLFGSKKLCLIISFVRHHQKNAISIFLQSETLIFFHRWKPWNVQESDIQFMAALLWCYRGSTFSPMRIVARMKNKNSKISRKRFQKLTSFYKSQQHNFRWPQKKL